MTQSSKSEEVIRSEDSPEEVKFAEVMQGSIHIGHDIDDFVVAERTAKAAASSARLFLNVAVARRESDAGGPRYTSSTVTGTFSCGALSQDPLLITGGKIRFFAPDEATSEASRLVYELQLLDSQDNTYHLRGFKHIDSGIAFSLSRTWKATTTLNTTIVRPDGSMVGRGIIRISFSDFLHELRSLIPSRNSNRWWKQMLSLKQFTAFFLGHVFHYFLGPLRPLEYPSESRGGYFDKPAPTTVPVAADDGTEIEIKIWEPSELAPKHDMPILLIPGVAVDDQIFSLPTIPTNTIDFFTSRGHRCYVPLMRFNKPELAQQGWTSYDTRWDVKAAMDFVRSREDGRKFYLICHCLGSISTAIALLTGVIDPNWIQGMTISQVFFNLRFSIDNRIKASTPTLSKLYRVSFPPLY